MGSTLLKEFSFEVKGTSMAPAIYSGDIVDVSICNSDEIKKGDIAVFWKNSTLFVHRVWGESGGAFFTKGDRCRNFDDPVRKERVFGRVESVTRITEGNWNFKKIFVRFLNISLVFVYSIQAGLKVRKLISTFP